jgi:hypothetical protein
MNTSLISQLLEKLIHAGLWIVVIDTKDNGAKIAAQKTFPSDKGPNHNGRIPLYFIVVNSADGNKGEVIFKLLLNAARMIIKYNSSYI